MKPKAEVALSSGSLATTLAVGPATIVTARADSIDNFYKGNTNTPSSQFVTTTGASEDILHRSKRLVP
jgi:hypothetical protein